MDNSSAFSVYSDETGLFDKRFQAIALVSGPTVHLQGLRARLQLVLSENRVAEIKFAEVRTHRPKLSAAQGFIRRSIKEYASRQKCRIDVLVWDTQDLRHTIRGRDDVANLGIMYYRVLTHTARQWRRIAWHLYPDTNPQINWHDIASYVNRTPLLPPTIRSSCLFDSEEYIHSIELNEIEPTDSLGEPLVQLADLFAGMARFSREEGKQCLQWLESWGNDEQLTLPDFVCGIDTMDDTIQTKQNRYKLIHELYSLCRQSKMGVSLRDRRYLWTPNPSNPINFWSYEPQHEYDQAPVRGDI